MASPFPDTAPAMGSPGHVGPGSRGWTLEPVVPKPAHLPRVPVPHSAPRLRRWMFWLKYNSEAHRPRGREVPAREPRGRPGRALTSTPDGLFQMLQLLTKAKDVLLLCGRQQETRAWTCHGPCLGAASAHDARGDPCVLWQPRPWIWTTRPWPSGARKPLLRAGPQAVLWLGVPRSTAPAGGCRQGPSGEHGARRGGSQPGSPTPLPPPSGPSSRALRPAASDDTDQMGSCARVWQPPPPAMRSLPHSAPGNEGPCLARPPQGGSSSRNLGPRAQARDESGAAAPHQQAAPPQWCPRLSPSSRSSLPEMPPQPGWQPMCPPQAHLTGKAVMVTQKLRVRDEGPGTPAGVGSEQVGGGAGQRAAVPGSARSALLLGAVGLSLCVGTLSHSVVSDSL